MPLPCDLEGRLRQFGRQAALFEQPGIGEADDRCDQVALDLQHHQAVGPVLAVVAAGVSRPPCGTEPKKSPIAWAPATRIRSGGIVISASSLSNATRPSMSTASQAVMKRFTSARSRAPVTGLCRCAPSRLTRARCRALVTAATE